MKILNLFFILLITFNVDCIDAFLESFAHSISQMSAQMTKVMEGVQQSVDDWADKVIENAKNEECIYYCPKGVDPLPKINYTYTPIGCRTFGMDVKDEDLPSKTMRFCCDQQQICYHRCNSTKTECDGYFQQCLHDQCFKLSKDYKQIIVCNTATKLMLMGILSFGCKTFKDAQREACICPSIDKNEL